MPIVFAIGFAVGWFLVALAEFLWKHRLIVIAVIAVWWVFSTINDGIDYAQHGSLAEQTKDISVTFDGTRDVSTRNMGSSYMYFDITINNQSDRTLTKIEGHCGDFWFHDEKVLKSGASDNRSYFFVDGDNKQDGPCVFTEAEFA